jgi:hypothetical protein
MVGRRGGGAQEITPARSRIDGDRTRAYRPRMLHRRLSTLGIALALGALAACAEPITEPAPDATATAPSEDAPAADAMPGLIYYKISDG